ncbi:Ger(x)C family spore germination protein [Bacillus cereus]|uniref:Ger(x)C family spore germination protein n=1 Tax=Bacillus cereus TaxID=1396 RepID=UPI0040418EA0
MFKNIISICTFCIFILLLTGCWDYRPLETLAFSAGIGIDKEKETYIVTIQFLNPDETSTPNRTNLEKKLVYQGKGRTIDEALSRATLNVPKFVFFANTQVVVIGENLARKGVQQVLDYLYRFRSMRPDFALVIAKQQKAAHLLHLIAPVSELSSEKMVNVIRKMYQGKTLTVGSHLDFFNTLTHMNAPYEGAVLAGFQAIEQNNSNKTNHTTKQEQVSSTGLAIFHKDKLLGWFSLPESIGYNYIMGTAHLIPESVSCSKIKNITGEVFASESKKNVYQKNSKFYAHVKLKVKLYLTSMGCQMQISPKNIALLESKFAKRIEQEMRQTVDRAQHTFRSDIFDFGNTFSRSSPQKWLSIQKKWKTYFVQMKVTYDVHVDIEHVTNNIYNTVN